jgi:predicted amidophosphoribosyltransferase
VRKSRLEAVAGKRVLRVDDVLTTGATLSACTRALKQAGARQVDVLVLARVVRETDVTI